MGSRYHLVWDFGDAREALENVINQGTSLPLLHRYAEYYAQFIGKTKQKRLFREYVEYTFAELEKKNALVFNQGIQNLPAGEGVLQ